ncbi:MAG TPA: hypothetical protein VMV04_14085 [Thermodesulfobacteriota bacterium]|nr:hypothetical protein [Thermodesulfobacteriota bacterium]
MKRAICLAGMGLLLVSMVLVSCAPMQKTVLTKSNLPTLKGNWQGWTTFSSLPSAPVLTYLQIANDTVPVQGNITLNNLPDNVALAFPADAKTAGGNVTINFSNGMITDQGTLIGQTGQNFLELTYYAGEKPKFNGWFYYYGAKGTVEFTKK